MTGTQARRSILIATAIQPESLELVVTRMLVSRLDRVDMAVFTTNTLQSGLYLVLIHDRRKIASFLEDAVVPLTWCSWFQVLPNAGVNWVPVCGRLKQSVFTETARSSGLSQFCKREPDKPFH